ncbi:PREDICTED: telomere length regulation protein TEL2 homolog [Tarenaya hassleriana]|uniref:telomere length regulation protein TEL2 homolog n=1 Tax=Tarenaya hassleriana TaxID=28532 RepID=UPI00053C30F4|nr:PREDICTED: telomere length regulation protein TEL2 homolog [Tarenaya hassleriana]
MAEETRHQQERKLEKGVLDKVGEGISAISEAKHVDQVICALHSVAVLLFPVDPSLFSGSISEEYRERVCSSVVPSATERNNWWQTFYRRAAFPTLARVLLLDVASDWLSCFPISVQRHLYDVFFLDGPAIEVVQVLVPFLQRVESSGIDSNSVQSNVERLLILCLLENDGVRKMARELRDSYQSDNLGKGSIKAFMSGLSQIVTSIPDKVRLKAPPLLTSHFYFKKITVQLLLTLDEMASQLETDSTYCILSFVGEIFSRICRRGSSDLLLSEVTPHVLKHVRRLLTSTKELVDVEVFEMDPAFQIWSKTMEVITDPFAVERIAEQLFHQLHSEHASDIEAFWTIWTLFHSIVKHQASARSMFVDKFLLWKVFPICCLRWILQFSVLELPPVASSLAKGDGDCGLLETTQRLASVWSKREFLQSVPLEQQAYVTAALGLCLEKMSREQLDRTKDIMPSILQGVSCRLESPTDLIRRMASSVAFVFSKVIDPKNPLCLDDTINEDTIDWEFGFKTTERTQSIESSTEKEDSNDLSQKNEENKKGKRSKKISEYVLVNPDEIIDLASLNCKTDSDKDDGGDDDDASVNSDTSSDTSLEPYDLTDDDKDLGRKFTHLVDVVGALRKTDDADGVEKAIDVAEKLIRASPDELAHIAGDLARTLVQVRCSDVAVEGEEESTEEKRQRALIALLVTRPLESLETLNNLLYSPNVDVSQRIMVLDVMTEAAQELANSRTLKPKHQARGPLISSISDPQPWYLPSNSTTPGAGPWKEVSETGPFLLNWSNRFERELQPKRGQIRKGKTRRWSFKSADRDQSDVEWSQNRFPLYAAAFMLPAMKEFDRKRHGVDLLGQDYVVLGKLLHMLGVCMNCASMHPEASALATFLLDLLQRREVCNHPEAYVRKAVLFAASSVLVALHPSFVVSALAEGNVELLKGLEWIRTWALHLVDSDIDRECYTMAMSCLRFHSEMALQTSRALESSAGNSIGPDNIGFSSEFSKVTSIKLPNSNVH